jgi:tricarballylate dehydrogenase
MRMKSVESVSSDFEEHFAENAGGYLDPTVIAETSRDPESWSAAAKSASFVDPNVWLRWRITRRRPGVGRRLRREVRDAGRAVPTSVSRASAPTAAAMALLEAFVPAFLSKGGTIRYNSAAGALCMSEDGSVEGVRGVGEGNRPFKVGAGAVILACGGFEGNAEMLKPLHGLALDLPARHVPRRLLQQG